MLLAAVGGSAAGGAVVAVAVESGAVAITLDATKKAYKSPAVRETLCTAGLLCGHDPSKGEWGPHRDREEIREIIEKISEASRNQPKPRAPQSTPPPTPNPGSPTPQPRSGFPDRINDLA